MWLRDYWWGSQVRSRRLQQPHFLYLTLLTKGASEGFKMIIIMRNNTIKGLPRWLNGKESTCHAGDVGSIPGSGRSSGGGNGNPVQYSRLENPLDRGAWRATVHGVAKNQHDLAIKQQQYDQNPHFWKVNFGIQFKTIFPFPSWMVEKLQVKGTLCS